MGLGGGGAQAQDVNGCYGYSPYSLTQLRIRPAEIGLYKSCLTCRTFRYTDFEQSLQHDVYH